MPRNPCPPPKQNILLAILLKIYFNSNTPPHPNKCLKKTWSQTPQKKHGVVFCSNTKENERSRPLPRLSWCYLQHPSVERWDLEFGFETLPREISIFLWCLIQNPNPSSRQNDVSMKRTKHLIFSQEEQTSHYNSAPMAVFLVDILSRCFYFDNFLWHVLHSTAPILAILSLLSPPNWFFPTQTSKATQNSFWKHIF